MGAACDHKAAKAALRRDLLARRGAVPDAERVLAAEAVARIALEHPLFADAGAGPVAGYWPMRGEIDPRPLMQALSVRGFALCLPVVAHPTLRFHAYAPGDELAGAGFGTQGPHAASLECAPRILLVPCLGFDRAGGRLGYGAGHYDRALERLDATSPVTAVALAFSMQQVAQLPVEAHDRALDAIVTESEWVNPE